MDTIIITLLFGLFGNSLIFVSIPFFHFCFFFYCFCFVKFLVMSVQMFGLMELWIQFSSIALLWVRILKEALYLSQGEAGKV